MRSSVDETQGGIVVPCGREDLREPRGLGGKDDRGICLTRVGPGGGASLGVKVHNERRVPVELGGNGQVERQGTFSPRRLSARRWLWSACRHGDVLTCLVQPSISRAGIAGGGDRQRDHPPVVAGG